MDMRLNETIQKLKAKGVPDAEAVRMAQAMHTKGDIPRAGGMPALRKADMNADRADLAREGKQTLSMGSGTGGLRSLIPLIMGMAAVGSMGSKGESGGGGSNDYQGMITNAANKYGVPPELATSVARAESNFNPKAKSPVGALGIMQLMPDTAKELGVIDPFDPAQNIDGGVRYLKQALDRRGGDIDLTLADYNAGMGNVNKYGGVPPFEETQKYITKVKGFMGGSAPQPQQAPAQQNWGSEGGDLSKLAPMLNVKATEAAPPMQRTDPPLIPSNSPSVEAALATGKSSAAPMMAASSFSPYGLAGMNAGMSLVGGLLDDSDEKAEEAMKDQERMQKQQRMLGGISSFSDRMARKNAEYRALLMGGRG